MLQFKQSALILRRFYKIFKITKMLNTQAQKTPLSPKACGVLIQLAPVKNRLKNYKL
jgi:hypothetical protein